MLSRLKPSEGRPPRKFTPVFGTVLALAMAVASCALAVGMAEAYDLATAISIHLFATPLEPWIAAATVHTVLAVLVIYWLSRQGDWTLFKPLSQRLSPLLVWGYAPALLVIFGALGLALVSGNFWPGGSQVNTVTPPTAWMVWIPIVEELVFRVGISRLFQKYAPHLWASWFAAICFALVHSHPTVANLLAARVGLPLGPFLLGLACEGLIVTTGRLLPAIVLHAACNATVLIFIWLDPRWLEWFGILYG